MTRITAHDLFPIVDGEIYQLGTVDMFFYRKRECPLWHKLTPITKLLCSKKSNTAQPIVNFGSYNNKYEYSRLIHYSGKYVVPYHVTSLTELQKY